MQHELVEVWVDLVCTYWTRACEWTNHVSLTPCRSCDKRLWSHIDVSRCSPLTNQALAGIIKRQPTSLDLSWTPLAKRQLNCLLTRLPGTNAHTHRLTESPPVPMSHTTSSPSHCVCLQVWGSWGWLVCPGPVCPRWSLPLCRVCGCWICAGAKALKTPRSKRSSARPVSSSAQLNHWILRL